MHHPDVTMNRRNGSVLKIVFGVSIFAAGVYFIYVYNNVSGKLKEAERLSERYRREQESLSAQLQDLSTEKEQLKQRCDSERKEFVNRLNSLQQQHKMLKTQHEDVEAEYSKLQAQMQKDNEDKELQQKQQSQEYLQFKQQKELEISSLKDDLANAKRDKEQAQKDVASLNTQLQNCQEELQKQRVIQQQQQQQIQQQQQQNLANQNVAQHNVVQQNVGQHQNEGQQQNVGGVPLDVNPAVAGGNLPIANQNGDNLVFQPPGGGGAPQNGFLQGQQGVQQMQQQEAVNQQHQQQDADKQKTEDAARKLENLEQHQQQHQVQPPNFNVQENKDNQQNEQIVNQDSIKIESKIGEDGKPVDDHDNRIHNQGPVALQVQEPVIQQAQPAQALDNNPVDNNPPGGDNVQIDQQVPQPQQKNLNNNLDNMAEQDDQKGPIDEKEGENVEQNDVKKWDSNKEI